MAAPPELPEGLPWWVYYWQYFLGAILTVAGVTFAACIQWYKGFREGEPAKTHAVLEQAELADMSAIRALKPTLEAITPKLATIEGIASKVDAMATKVDLNSSKLETILAFMDFDRTAARESRNHIEGEFEDVKDGVEKIDRRVEILSDRIGRKN